MILNNRVYDILKWVAQLVLPAMATLWYALATVWNFPLTDQVLGTIVAVNVCLGVMLKISDSQWSLTKRLEGANVLGHSEFEEDEKAVSLSGGLSPVTYNFLKWLTIFGLPALGTLYFTLAELWGFPYGPQIVATVTAAATFLGVLLGVSSAQFKKSDF